MFYRNLEEDRRVENDVVYYDRGVVTVDGKHYQRLAVQTHFVERGESYLELMEKYVMPVAREGDILSISEKIIAMCQNNVVEMKDVEPGFWAKILARFASYGSHGLGLHQPHKMQLAINLAGLPRILLATFCSAVTKLFGKKGVFFKIAGHGIAGIDGFYPYSSFELYKTTALLNPREPDAVCNEILEKFGIVCMIVDANDLAADIFGRCDKLSMDWEHLYAIIKDNPAGQADELTPLILLREVSAEEAAEDAQRRAQRTENAEEETESVPQENPA